MCWHFFSFFLSTQSFISAPPPDLDVLRASSLSSFESCLDDALPGFLVLLRCCFVGEEILHQILLLRISCWLIGFEIATLRSKLEEICTLVEYFFHFPSTTEFFHIHLSKPTSHEWLMDLQLCHAFPPQPAPGCVYTSSFFLRLPSSSWSEHVWELGGPAAESPDLQAGPDFRPSLSSSGSPQPGIQRGGLAVLRWPAEAEKCHQSGKSCWGQGQYSKGSVKLQVHLLLVQSTRNSHAPQLFYPRRQNQRWQKYSVKVWILV